MRNRKRKPRKKLKRQLISSKRRKIGKPGEKKSELKTRQNAPKESRKRRSARRQPRKPRSLERLTECHPS